MKILKQTWLTVILISVSLSALADHASVGFGVGSASPINTESGVPLSENQWSTGVRLEHIQFDQYTDQELRDLREQDPEADLHSVDTVNQVSIGAAYGITDNLSVGFRMPIVMRNNIREPEHGHAAGPDPVHIENLGDVSGIGDVTFFGQYRFFQHEGSHVSALFGVKTPTGETNRLSNDGEVFEAEFQPGSGSWDGLMGIAFTQELGVFNFDTNILYSVVTEGIQDTDLGDIFDYNFALSYALLGSGDNIFASSDFKFDLIGELNGEWRDKQNTGGEFDNNSGGNILYLSPGFRFTAKETVNLGFSFGIPIGTALNGDQVKPDYRIVTTLNVNL